MHTTITRQKQRPRQERQDPRACNLSLDLEMPRNTARSPVMDPVLDFGKYRGRRISSLSVKYLKYLAGPGNPLRMWARMALAELVHRGYHDAPVHIPDDVLRIADTEPVYSYWLSTRRKDEDFYGYLVRIVIQNTDIRHVGRIQVGDLVLEATRQNNEVVLCGLTVESKASSSHTRERVQS